MSKRIPTVKVLESHELRLRKLEGRTKTDTETETNITSKTNELEPVKREVEGMKRDMHQIAKDIQTTKTNQTDAQKLEKRLVELEKSVDTLEISLAKLRDFAMTSNQDLLRFREQVFENKQVTLQIQETQESEMQKKSQKDKSQEIPSGKTVDIN